MSNVVLQKPEAGQKVTHVPQPDALFSINFLPADALMEKIGDNLVFSFDDGAQVVIKYFYTAFSSKNMPDFLIDGALVEGKEFFAALNEDIMPAAGFPMRMPTKDLPESDGSPSSVAEGGTGKSADNSSEGDSDSAVPPVTPAAAGEDKGVGTSVGAGTFANTPNFSDEVGEQDPVSPTKQAQATVNAGSDFNSDSGSGSGADSDSDSGSGSGSDSGSDAAS